jgi:predicted acylesterase/phospholipase RssA
MADLKHHRPCGRSPFECIALLWQGGGALGAYQGGVYEDLAEAGLHPDWTGGISIGAINVALFASTVPAAGHNASHWELRTISRRCSGRRRARPAQPARSAGRVLSLGTPGIAYRARSYRSARGERADR